MNTNWFYSSTYKKEQELAQKRDKITRIRVGLITFLCFILLILLSWMSTII